MNILKESGKVDEILLEKVQAYLNENQSLTPVVPRKKLKTIYLIRK